MTSTKLPQVGETPEAYVFTSNGWVPATTPPKKKHTVLKVFLGLCALGVVAMIALIALPSAGANHVANSTTADENKPGGTNNPMTITAGKAFEVDGFNYAGSWKIAN